MYKNKSISTQNNIILGINKPSDILLKDIDTKKKHDFGNQIAKLVHDYFDSKLPNKKGKPQLGHEWTVLAAIVVEKVFDNQNEMKNEVSLRIYIIESRGVRGMLTAPPS